MVLNQIHHLRAESEKPVIEALEFDKPILQKSRRGTKISVQ